LDSNDAKRQIFSLSQVNANSIKHLKEEAHTMKKSMLPVVLFVIVVTCVFSAVGSGQAQKNKPPADIPLRVTLAGSANDDPPSGYRIVSDGRDYVDGLEGVIARIGEDHLNIDPVTTTVAMPRTFYFDFSAKIADGSIPNPWGGPGLKAIDSYVQIDSVRSIAVGTTAVRSGRIGQIYAGTGRKETMYRVTFNPDPAGPYFSTVNSPNIVSAFQVSHPDCNTWVITPTGALYTDPVDGSTRTGAVAAFVYASDPAQSTGQDLMPMQMTVTRKTPITCP
jgi:hypothetical protein